MPAFARILFWIMLAVAAFHAAYATPNASFLAVLYLFALLQLAQADRWRKAFYSGLAVGLLIALVRLQFFWRLFSGGAVALWLVYAFWIGLFVALVRLCLTRLSPRWGWLLIPFVWTGVEYFRSELYYLRFAWLNAGYAFIGAPWQTVLKLTGVYGLGLLLMSIAAGAAYLWQKSRIRSCGLLALGAAGIYLGGLLCGQQPLSQSPPRIHVAGVQMEFPAEREVLLRLNELIRSYPQTELVVLSEYTFAEPVPEAVRKWCRKNRRHLVVGGKAPAPGGNFYDTAFVIGPSGNIVFRQVKAVPIQFFKDGLPAVEQRLWDSPWGKIGICVCYDLSYTRVTDRLVKLGAQALVVPTMDLADWGKAQHELHARIAPARATEYGLPIFRVASSGISQSINCAGQVIASAPCPGAGAILAGTLKLEGVGKLPLDRWLAPFATAVTAVVIGWLWIRRGAGTASTAGSEGQEV